MHKNSVLILAALGAACLLPAGSALAQNDSNSPMPSNNDSSAATQSHTSDTGDHAAMGKATETSGSLMDVGQFRDSLNRVRTLFTQMRENRRLTLASNDSLTQSQLQEMNRGLLVKTLGVLDQITRQWHSSEIPTGTMTAQNGDISRYGSANALRYANESEDTAWVRNTVWQLQDRLFADKLSGRGPIITNQMVSMLDAAIERANNPTFRVAYAPVVISEREQVAEATTATPPAPTETAPAPETNNSATNNNESGTTESTNSSSTTTEENKTTTETAPPPAAENTAPATSQEETTTTDQGNNENAATSSETIQENAGNERMGSANLPKTGGDPSMLFLLGSGIGALGMVIRKKR